MRTVPQVIGLELEAHQEHEEDQGKFGHGAQQGKAFGREQRLHGTGPHHAEHRRPEHNPGQNFGNHAGLSERPQESGQQCTRDEHRARLGEEENDGHGTAIRSDANTRSPRGTAPRSERQAGEYGRP